jgi:hypothetical protein
MYQRWVSFPLLPGSPLSGSLAVPGSMRVSRFYQHDPARSPATFLAKEFKLAKFGASTSYFRF